MLDEVDAADPNLMVVINAAIANGRLSIPFADLPPGQDVNGRLRDVLTMLKYGIRHATDPTEARFTVAVWDGRRHENVDLKAICGPGDEGAPVLTIMLTHED